MENKSTNNEENKTQQLFGKISRNVKLLANCTRANKEITQVIRMKNKKCICTDLKGIK